MNGDLETERHYQTIADLGGGGMADVSLAVVRGSEGFRKLVVIKKLRPILSDDRELVEMLRREARLAAMLNHPNIVQTLDFGEHEGRQALVMEYLEGQSLHAIRRKVPHEAFPLAHQLEILVQVLAALDYAHNLSSYEGEPLRIVHRDVSPHNVFVTYVGQTKLVDFGVARAVFGHIATTGTAIKGKLAYMSPEHERGDPVDPRSDLFSVGVMLWEALVGRPLWAGLSDIAIVSRLRFGEVPSPASMAADVPPSLGRVCMRALAHRCADRYPSAAQFKRELETCMSQLNLRATSNEIGPFVADLFREDRARLEALVKDRLRTAATPEASTSLLRSPSDRDDATPSSPSTMSRWWRTTRRQNRVAWAVVSASFLLLGVFGGATVGSRLAGRSERDRSGTGVDARSAPPGDSAMDAPTGAESKTGAPDSPKTPIASVSSPTASVEPAGPPTPKRRKPVPAVATSDALSKAAASASTPVPPASTTVGVPTPGGVIFDDPWAPTGRDDGEPGSEER